MVKCNVKGCQELAPVQISDCVGEQHIHLCYKHSAEYDTGIINQEDMEIDFYQKWENMQ